MPHPFFVNIKNIKFAIQFHNYYHEGFLRNNSYENYFKQYLEAI